MAFHCVCSLLQIETADRPGLLIEILKVLSDISVVVESAEVDTEVSIIGYGGFCVLLSVGVLQVLALSFFDSECTPGM